MPGPVEKAVVLDDPGADPGVAGARGTRVPASSVEPIDGLTRRAGGPAAGQQPPVPALRHPHPTRWSRRRRETRHVAASPPLVYRAGRPTRLARTVMARYHRARWDRPLPLYLLWIITSAAYLKHRPLELWCPHCRDRDDGNDEDDKTPDPTPDPVAEKHIDEPCATQPISPSK